MNDQEFIRQTNRKLARRSEAKRSESLQKSKESIAKACFGITLNEAHEKKICIQCKKKVGKIEDEPSRIEYEISGLCPSCQSEFFD